MDDGSLIRDVDEFCFFIPGGATVIATGRISINHPFINRKLKMEFVTAHLTNSNSLTRLISYTPPQPYLFQIKLLKVPALKIW